MKLLSLLIVCLSLTPTVYADIFKIDREKYSYHCYGGELAYCKDLEKGDELIDVYAAEAAFYCDKDELIIRNRSETMETKERIDGDVSTHYKYNCSYNGKEIKPSLNLRGLYAKP